MVRLHSAAHGRCSRPGLILSTECDVVISLNFEIQKRVPGTAPKLQLVDGTRHDCMRVCAGEMRWAVSQRSKTVGTADASSERGWAEIGSKAVTRAGKTIRQRALKTRQNSRDSHSNRGKA